MLSSHTHDREAAAWIDSGFPRSAAGHDPNGCCRTSLLAEFQIHIPGEPGFILPRFPRYDASVVTKDDAGKVHVNKDEMATRHRAWDGAVVGIRVPPFLIARAAIGHERGPARARSSRLSTRPR